MELPYDIGGTTVNFGILSMNNNRDTAFQTYKIPHINSQLYTRTIIFFLFQSRKHTFFHFFWCNSFFIPWLYNLTLILLTKSYFILYFKFFKQFPHKIFAAIKLTLSVWWILLFIFINTFLSMLHSTHPPTFITYLLSNTHFDEFQNVSRKTGRSTHTKNLMFISLLTEPKAWNDWANETKK